MLHTHPSPNHGPRRGVSSPDMVVLHYTAMATAEAARDRLCDPEHEVSAHYLVAEDGRTWALVPEERRAWHAGVGQWGRVMDVNSHSIGIELANPGDAPFASRQMTALETLLGALRTRWQIPAERIVGHACIAPGRKFDPGRRFDWRRLALGGHAIWRDPPRPDGSPADAAAFQSAARAFGYGAPDSGAWCAATRTLWQAYDDRFLSWGEPRVPDGAGVRHLKTLARTWPVVDPAPDNA